MSADPMGGAVPTAAPDWEAFDRLVDARIEGWVAELIEFLAIPSEGGDEAHLREAAEWTAARMRHAGAAVDVVELPGVPPLVVGEFGDGPRTLASVVHYDVQPAAPLNLWATPPYEPVIRDGRVWGRGATDNKGEFLPRVWALEAYRDAIGPLPCRVRHLVEGQEETGSGALNDLLDQRPGLREADAALIEGGDLDFEGRATVYGGGKGIVVLELVLRTLAHDAHSSLSVLLPNAAHRLVTALATFWDSEGHPAIDGLDAGKRPPAPDQLEAIRAMDLAALDDLRQDFGVARFVGGLDGYEAAEALTFQTTLNIQGLWSGHTEPTPKTVTPAEARARLDIRIVPDQEPAEITAAVRRHLNARGYADIEIIEREGEPAWWTPPSHPVVQLAARVSEAVTGKPASIGVSMAGTVPMHQVCAEHRVPATMLGAGRADANLHAPDENIRIEDLVAATRMMARFVDALARLPEVPRVP
ncbi:MAG TPA: M20/M25/M40 family metallo-hydrolase [Candidatus Nanopelagicales bacterium]|nr:M20/M25/M40 family metallo-hydrolase [Candidatus Nanopelagicales bacterium]